ncbi:MAG: hypothetical protein J0H83_11715 [Candidatus Melainabacteria bacterium]|jgi:hypothetical protein|nr:hypothetical protein [Candidatus Melainabacteria bacterium]MBX9674635.1 hypothetical protein [Candidatus Obscuribacterales bacterium]
MQENQDADTDRDELDDEQPSIEEKSKTIMREVLKKFVLALSFGPGVLGFIWLLGKIVRR